MFKSQPHRLLATWCRRSLLTSLKLTPGVVGKHTLNGFHLQLILSGTYFRSRTQCPRTSVPGSFWCVQWVLCGSAWQSQLTTFFRSSVSPGFLSTCSVGCWEGAGVAPWGRHPPVQGARPTPVLRSAGEALCRCDQSPWSADFREGRSSWVGLA